MDKVRFRQVLRRVFLAPFGVGAFLAVILIGEVQFLVNREGWVEHADQVIAISQRLYRTRVDQEDGLRAYLLTHDKRVLELFNQRRETAKALEAQLGQLISDNPEQRARNELAIRAHQEWSRWADQAIVMSNAGDLEFQFRGEALMDRYRAAHTDFVNREEQLRDERVANSRRTLRFVNVSVFTLCIVMGGVLAGLGRGQVRELAKSFNETLDTAQANAAETREQKEWFQTTLKSIGDAVIATDSNGKITFTNPVAERLTNWMSSEAIGQPLDDVFHIVNQHSRQIVENPIDKVRRLNRVVGLANHTILISKNGQEYAIDDSGAPIFGPNGAMIGIVLIFRDVTQQRALEAALQSNERLALAGRLSASIAHEIHNPLDTVGNVLFLLMQETNGQQKVQQLIGMAQREVHRVAETSKNMLSLHRESRNAKPFKLSELLESVVTLVEETIAKGKRTIQIEHGFSGEIEGFPAELRQVFTNVIKNAVEATAEGGKIGISSTAAKEAGCDGVLIQVTDNGTGIPDQMQSRLFSPFATTKQENGTGLGLWVSRSIVEKHCGAIRIGARADKEPGTTVSIFLHLKVAAWSSGDEGASADERTADAPPRE